MQRESGSQKAIIKEFRNLGFFVGAGSLSPGYPDVTAIKGNRVILIELKDITGIGPGVSVLSLFQRAQLPFYLSYLRDSGGNINIVFKKGDEYYLYTMRRISDAALLIDTNISDFLLHREMFESVKEIVRYISS